MSLVAARMTSLKIEMVVLAVESRDHVKGILTWAIVMMRACNCEFGRLEMRSLEMEISWLPCGASDRSRQALLTHW